MRSPTKCNVTSHTGRDGNSRNKSPEHHHLRRRLRDRARLRRRSRSQNRASVRRRHRPRPARIARSTRWHHAPGRSSRPTASHRTNAFHIVSCTVVLAVADIAGKCRRHRHQTGIHAPIHVLEKSMSTTSSTAVITGTSMSPLVPISTHTLQRPGFMHRQSKKFRPPASAELPIWSGSATLIGYLRGGSRARTARAS